MRSPGTNHGLLVYALALVAVAFCSMSASAQERITDFSSDITVSSSGTLTVKETIAVHAEGRAIRHGIYRDLPGFPLFSRFNVEQVQRDGHAEPYAVKWTWSGRHVRIGDANVDVPIGEHTYVIVYTTARVGKSNR